jgi:hypothetical protein
MTELVEGKGEQNVFKIVPPKKLETFVMAISGHSVDHVFP